MKKKEPTKNECSRCKGTGFIEIFQEELGFSTLETCPECDKGVEEILGRLLEGYAYKKSSSF